MDGPTSLAAPLKLDRLIDPSPSNGPARGGPLPELLDSRYGGDLAIPLRSSGPTMIANFVTTLDGVVSYGSSEAAGGTEISGSFEPDRFLMGLLRALADAVLIGAGTLRAAPDEAWTPAFIHPPSATAFGEFRRRLGLPAAPTTVLVSGSGAVDLGHPGLADPRTDVLLITTERGAARLAGRAVPGSVRIRAAGQERVAPRDLMRVLDEHGVRLVLCEGGPRLFGQLLAAGLVDELFLTLAPQTAGRSAGARRLALVEGSAFSVAAAPWARLIGLRRAGDHLFARYRFRPEEVEA